MSFLTSVLLSFTPVHLDGHKWGPRLTPKS